MNKIISRYFLLKNKQKEIEEELQQLKKAIITHLEEQQTKELEIGRYKVKIVLSERKEYDDGLLYESLPDKEIWRLLSKPDVTKINSLIKMGVINEQLVEKTYQVKPQIALYVDKK